MSDPTNGKGQTRRPGPSNIQRAEQAHSNNSSLPKRKRVGKPLPPKPNELIRLPGVVWKAWNDGRVVIPQYLKGTNKAPCIGNLARFDDRNLTLEELVDAANEKWAFWAFRLGPQTGWVALDFDQRHGGMETFEQLGLPAHVETPRWLV